MKNDYEFYKICDYEPSVYVSFYKRKTYLNIRGEIKNVLVYSATPHLGDLVFLSPFLRTLKKAFPEAKIWLLGKVHSSLKSLLEAIPGLEGHLPYSPRYGIRTVANYHRISQLYRDRKFDLLIDTQRRFIPSLIASYLFKPKYNLGYSSRCFFSDWKFSEPNRRSINIAAQLMLLLRILGIEDCSYKPELNIHSKYLDVANNYLKSKGGTDKKLVGIIPGVGNRKKCWQKEDFASVGDYISKKYGYVIVLFGGKDEEDILTDVANLMKSSPLVPILDDSIFSDDLLYSAALMKRCLFVIGSESGGIHLATAVGRQVIVIYGPTQPTKFGPLGDRNIVINHHLSCSPCKGSDCEIGRKCLKEIRPGEVIGAAEFLVNAVVR